MIPFPYTTGVGLLPLAVNFGILRLICALGIPNGSAFTAVSFLIGLIAAVWAGFDFILGAMGPHDDGFLLRGLAASFSEASAAFDASRFCMAMRAAFVYGSKSSSVGAAGAAGAASAAGIA